MEKVYFVWLWDTNENDEVVIKIFKNKASAIAYIHSRGYTVEKHIKVRDMNHYMKNNFRYKKDLIEYYHPISTRKNMWIQERVVQ